MPASLRSKFSVQPSVRGHFSCNVASGNYLGFTLSYFPYCVKGHFELPTTLVTLPKGQFPRNPTARCPNTCGDNRQLPAPQSVRLALVQHNNVELPDISILPPFPGAPP